MFLLWIIFVISVSCLSCFLVCSLQPCGHLLGKGWPRGSLICDVLLCFCHFPMWCPGSGVVLDCIDSWYVPLFYFYNQGMQTFHKNIWAATWDFQQCGMCGQQRLRPACAYSQSDQSLCLSLDLILFDLILYVPSTIFQLYRDGSSWVEPVLS